MIDIKDLRTYPKKYQESANARGVKVDIQELLKFDHQRSELIKQIDDLRSQLNIKQKPTSDRLQELKGKKSRLEDLEQQLTRVESEYDQLLAAVPNLHSEDTPIGKDDSGNRVLKQVGKPQKFSFEPKPHWELGQALDMIDNERAARVTGARFTYLKGNLAKLQFALGQFVLDLLTDEQRLKSIIKQNQLKVSSKPFTPVVPPVLIRPEVMHKMARLEPKDERYHIPSDDLYLIGSAEHTIGPMHMDETLPEELLPLRYIGYSTSFRREAGSYGKDTRGILRVHQFDKWEMESFCLPEDSLEEQNFFIAIQEEIMHSLEIPYQIVIICTGDMAAPDFRQIDIESWMPGQNKYRETHTADLMTDYQARRLHTRIRRKNAETELVHMNDATACALGRTLIAILENHQTAEGKVKVPRALVKYYGGEEL